MQAVLLPMWRTLNFIPDAYEAILQAERDGLITILRYEEMSEAMREWNKRTIKENMKKRLIIRNSGIFSEAISRTS